MNFRKIVRILFLICFTAVIFTSGLLAQENEYIRSYLTINDGLSQNEVTSIGEDQHGFMWFGTRGGLNRYDGFDVKIFKPSRQSEGSILNPSVECLFFDKGGNAWIGTKSGGISIYDPHTENFISGDSMIEDLPNRVVAVLEDMEGLYWIGGFYDGLKSFDPVSKETRTWYSSRNVQSIVQTPDSTIWVGARNSLLYKRNGEEFNVVPWEFRNFTITEIQIDPENPWLWLSGWGLPLVRFNYEDFSYTYYDIPNSMMRIYSLLPDQDGKIWVGTWGSGLYSLDKQDGELTKVDIYPDARFSKISDYDIILDIYQDSEGLIWVGTDGGGVVMLSPSRGFNSVNSFNKGEKYHVTSIHDLGDESIIVGTRDQGLMISSDFENFKRIKVQERTEESSMQNIYSTGMLNEDLYWVGMERGLHLLERTRGGDWELVHASIYFNSPDINMGAMKVLSVQQRGDELWVATQQRGLFLYLKKDGKYDLIRRFNENVYQCGLESNRVSVLLMDEQNHLWAGTYNGLYRFDDRDSLFIPLENLLSDSDKPLCNIILCSYLDSKNSIWFGTPCSLNKLYSKDGGESYILKEYIKGDGLPDDYISNILEDAEGNIWFSSNAGISRLNTGTGDIYHFESGDGTGEYNFSESAAYRSQDGVLYFGGFSGFTYFSPEELIYNKTSPLIAITSFKVMNREVKVSPDGILPVSVNDVEKIVLGHKDKEISIEFVALDYKSPASTQYQYKLERSGMQSEWEYIGNRHMISYQNLKSGEYILYLKGSNSNGVWSENIKELKIKVMASPLKRWYAILGYILLILIIIILIIRVSLKQERLKSQAQMEHIELEQEKQINEYKLRFFTNISHEFRTPLSMIIAPLNELVKNENKDLNRSVLKKIGLVQKNANRLLKLVNQLIEFRKVEVGKVKIEAAEQDIVAFLKEIYQPFTELARQKGVDFKFEFKIKKALLYFDARKLSVVTNNLLNNAFKYCGNPGSVLVLAEEDESDFRISFINDGKEISASDIEQIFDRFYQVSSSRYQDSSGIGLALVKNYVEMHKGSIFVESSPESMTKFEVKLKKGRDHFSDDEISNEAEQKAFAEEFILEQDEDSGSNSFHHLGTKGAKILVIDDNKDVRDYLRDLMSPYYDIVTAENGKVGFDKAVVENPDLILSDIMMPEMDGYELCARLKSHEQLSHVPFAMLTAKDTSSDMIFGAKKGADYYITKPFDPELLLEKIRQILTSRKNLASKLSRKITLDPVDKEVTLDDEKILKAAISIIEKNIEDDNLNLDLLADEMAMSSSTLYRKMKAICGQSPGEFIRSVRFKRAAQLLRDSDLAVSEIIEQVGYRSVKQFRENFKSEYGTSPASYRKQFREGEPPLT